MVVWNKCHGVRELCRAKSEQLMSMGTDGAGTERTPGISPFRWALHKPLMVGAVKSWDTDSGCDDFQSVVSQTGLSSGGWDEL